MRIHLAASRWDRAVDSAFSTGLIEAQQEMPPSQRVPVLYIDLPQPPLDEGWGGKVPLEDLSHWIETHRPDSVLGFGPAVRPQLEALGYPSPKRIGFADLFLTRIDGTVAGMRHNCSEVGALAIEQLAAHLQLNKTGLPRFPTTALVQGTWFDGTSLPAWHEGQSIDLQTSFSPSSENSH